jgi:subtilisin-like proprotein convertase family protein
LTATFAALQLAQGGPDVGTTVRVVSFESEPDLAIPDRNAAGVVDTIVVSESGTIRSVQVDVEIAHTYRGDLKLELIAPNGTIVPLFGRGAPVSDSRNDLVATFDIANVPALSQVTGANALGNWSLRVTDMAAADFGTLKKWVLRVGMKAIQTEWESNPGTRIPDNNATGISSPLDVDGGGTLQDISATVDISHTFRGDLRVVVESPSGKTATLKSVNNRDGVADLEQTFTLRDTPALQVFLNEAIRGRWILHVSDNLSADEGKLNSWGVKLLV